MLSKELLEEIRAKTRDINKLKSVEERIASTIDFKYSVQGRINDEIDELFSEINLKKTKNED